MKRRNIYFSIATSTSCVWYAVPLTKIEVTLKKKIEENYLFLNGAISGRATKEKQIIFGEKIVSGS